MRFSRKLSRVQRPDQHGSSLGVQCLQLLVGCASYLPLAKLLCMSPHTPREHDSSPRSSVRRSSRDSRGAFGPAATLSTVLGGWSDWRDCDELLAGVNAVEAPSWYQYLTSGSNRLGWRRVPKADVSTVAHDRLDERAIVACSSTTWRTCASIQHGSPPCLCGLCRCLTDRHQPSPACLRPAACPARFVGIMVGIPNLAC